AASQMLGHSGTDLVGRNLRTVFEGEFSAAFDELMTCVASESQFQSEVVITRRNGGTFNADIHGTGIFFRGRPHALAVIRDVTERAQAYQLLEQRLAERTQEISTLLRVSQNAAATLELRPLLALLLDGLSTLLDFSGAAISAVDEQGLRVVDFRGPVTGPLDVALTQVLDRISRQDDIRRGEAVIIADTQSDGELGVHFRDLLGSR